MPGGLVIRAGANVKAIKHRLWHAVNLDQMA
jgi:hypothetical protein